MPHHRFLPRLHLQQINTLDTAIGEIDGAVNERIAPFRTGVEQLIASPGIDELSARMILAEFGTDMSRFPTAAHFLSWACMCSRNDESAVDPHAKGGLLGSRASRSNVPGRRSREAHLSQRPVKTICAVAVSLLTAIYHMLKDGTYYQDLGHDYFDRRAKTTQTKRLVARLPNLGYAVQIAPLQT